MAKLNFNARSVGFFTVTLIILTLFISFSSSCLPSYVPDSDVEDHIPYPWSKWKGKNRKFDNTCQCGDDHQNGINHYSWNSLIRTQSNSSAAYLATTYCSGALINSHFILTAYSCLIDENFNSFQVWGPKKYRLQPNHVKVWLNIDDAMHINPEENPDGLPISEIIYNPGYISSFVMKRARGHNIVLLRLKDKINFKSPDSPKPVCIYPSLDIKSGTHATIFGWANKPKVPSKPGEIQMQQKSTSTVIFDVEECRRGTDTSIDDDSFCTGGKDLISSEGLEGRILAITSSQSNINLQVGVTSWIGTHIEKNQYGQAGSLIFYTILKPILPFIFYHSEKANAVWCKEPAANHFSHVQVDEAISSSITRLWRGFSSEHRAQSIWEPGCTCGTHDATQGRIVGGVEATPHEFKWQVLLKIMFLLEGKKTRTICGGSIINDRFIITAAHCVVQREILVEGEYPGVLPEEITATVHVHQKSDDPDGIIVGIKSVWYHPDYVAAQLTKNEYMDYDVALLELDKPLIYDPKKIVPICLPTSDKKLEVIGKNAVVSGWGLTIPKGSVSETLQKLVVPIQTLDYCRSVAVNKITENFICAGTLTRYKDASQGDSGGPLSITYNSDNQYVQVGIVSWGDDNPNSNTLTAALYTDVQTVLDAIDYHSHMAGAKWCPP